MQLTKLYYAFIHFTAPLLAHDVFMKYRIDIKNIVQLEMFMDHFISRKIILAKQKESVTMDSLLSTIESELESGIDGTLNAMLDVMKSYGTVGPRTLAEKIEQELPQLEEEKSIAEAATVEFNINDRVEDMFLQLVHAIGGFLKSSNCEFTLLRGACIKADKFAAKINNIPNNLLEKINATKNLDELLEVLIVSPYCNWINVRVFEKMVAFSNQREAKKLIDNYKTIIFSKKLMDVLQNFTGVEVTGEYYTKVRERWNKNIEDITLEDVAKHWSKLQSIFDVDDLELLLENVIKGSIEIVWLIPVELASHARLSAFKNWCDLEDVSYLSIGDHVIKNDQLEFTEEHISITTGILT